MNKKTLIITLLVVAILVLCCCSVIGGIMLISQGKKPDLTKYKVNTLQLFNISPSSQNVSSYAFNQTLDEVYFIAQEEGQSELVLKHWKLGDTQSRVVTKLTSDKPDLPLQMVVSTTGDVYVIDREFSYDFEKATITLASPKGQITTYTPMLPQAEFLKQDTFNASYIEKRKTEKARLCNEFLASGTSYLGIIGYNQWDFSKVDQERRFIINPATGKVLPLPYCDGITVTGNITGSEVQPARPFMTPYTIDEANNKIADSQNRLVISWTKHVCFDVCTYNYRIEYGNELFLLEKELVSPDMNVSSTKGEAIKLSLSNELIMKDSSIVVKYDKRLWWLHK